MRNEALMVVVAVLGIGVAVLVKREAKHQRFCEMLAVRVDRLHAMTTEPEKNLLTHYVPIFRHECQGEVVK